MASPSLKRASQVSTREWSQPCRDLGKFPNDNEALDNYATIPGSVPKRQRRQLRAYPRTAKPIELSVNDRHAHPDEQGWTALSGVSAIVSPRNLSNQPSELRSIDKLGSSHVYSVPLSPTTHLPTWPTDMSGDGFGQSEAECNAATIAPSTAFSYGIPESIQSDSGSLVNSSAYAGMSMDLFLDEMFSTVHESDGFGPLGSLGSLDSGGWVENIGRPSQPYPQPMWNDFLLPDQSHEHYTDNGFWNVPHSTDRDLPLHHTGPYHIELGLSTIPTQPDSLLETEYQWPPRITDSTLWDGFHTLGGNFVPPDSERQELCTVKPYMTSYGVQTSFKPTSESHQLSSSTCASMIPQSKCSCLILASSSNSSTSQEKFTRILLPKLKKGPKSYDNSQTNVQDTLTESTGEMNILQPIKWEHTPASELRGQIVKNHRKAGRRNGRLGPVRARKAQEIRRIHACLPCWLLKIPCSAGDICLRCKSLKATNLAPIICTRKNLEDYAELFFPGILVSHLRQSAVENLTGDLCKGFVINDVEADLNCGSENLPIRLRVAEFAPASPKVSYIHTITYGRKDKVAMFTQRYPPPMALRDYSIGTLVDKCRTYVRCLARNQRDLSGMTPKNTNEISKKILEAISRYHGSICPSRNTALLDKTIMLYNVHYFMGRTVKFTNKTADKVASALRQPITRPYENTLISRLLNRQIKSAMHCLLRDLTREVLEELEKELKTRSKAVWATSFCVISIICICMEDVQIAINGLIMDMKVNSSESHIPSSEECIEICRKLDDIPFEHAVSLFHGIYKTQKAPSTHRNGHVYNPIRDGARIDFKEDLDQESADLVNDVRKILRNHYAEIIERARVPSFDFGLESLKQHMIFRENNSGRLLSTFLKSFKD